MQKHQKSPDPRDHIGREVNLTILQGNSEWIGDWEIICVKQEDTPIHCNICETPITEMKDLGAWKLHSASPICVGCVSKYEIKAQLQVEKEHSV